MTKVQTKVLCFEYMIDSLLKWYTEKSYSSNPVVSFTRLKALKLLFLVSAVNATEKDNNLLDIFDRFYAMQHGPVESDIYNAMVTSGTNMFDFGERITTIKNENILIFEKIPNDFKLKIDTSIKSLKVINASIVHYNSFELVEITHKWESWRVAMEIAQILGRRSELMSVESIKCDYKYFY